MASRRRILLPIIVVAAACAIALWSAQGRKAEIADIERVLRAWGETAARGGVSPPPFRIEPSVIAGTVQTGLDDLAAALRATPDRWMLTVAAGPGPDASGSAASHHARFSVAGRERFGLRLVTDDDGPIIIGCWAPPASAFP